MLHAGDFSVSSHLIMASQSDESDSDGDERSMVMDPAAGIVSTALTTTIPGTVISLFWRVCGSGSFDKSFSNGITFCIEW